MNGNRLKETLGIGIILIAFAFLFYSIGMNIVNSPIVVNEDFYPQTVADDDFVEMNVIQCVYHRDTNKYVFDYEIFNKTDEVINFSTTAATVNEKYSVGTCIFSTINEKTWALGSFEVDGSQFKDESNNRMLTISYSLFDKDYYESCDDNIVTIVF